MVVDPKSVSLRAREFRYRTRGAYSLSLRQADVLSITLSPRGGAAPCLPMPELELVCHLAILLLAVIHARDTGASGRSGRGSSRPKGSGAGPAQDTVSVPVRQRILPRR